MSLTLPELKEKLLQRYDADILIEMLNISAEELLDAFDEKIIDRFEKLEEEFGEESF